jgi:hypothetical protein
LQQRIQIVLDTRRESGQDFPRISPLAKRESTTMAEKKSDEPKTLEMRVAELEDKLSKIHITEEEMKAYHKVSSLLAGQPMAEAAPASAAPQLSPIVCIISRGITPRGISPRGISPRGIIGECYPNECSCGPCSGPGGGGFGGGFGGFGM